MLISAIDIAGLWFFEPSEISADLTGEALSTLLAKSSTRKIENVHQGTFAPDEAEASQDKYKNQLTGGTYRVGAKEMGDVTVAFTIGQYSYQDKAILMGGTATDTSWKRARGTVDIKKGVCYKTQDGQYAVFPYCNISAREGNTDGAIGLNVTCTVLEPISSQDVMPEYWFDKSEVEGD